MSRGTDCVVPKVPGLVSDTVAPAKSSGVDRARRGPCGPGPRRRGGTRRSRACRRPSRPAPSASACRRAARRRRRARGRRARGGRRRACPCRRSTSTKVALSAGTLLERAEDREGDEVGEGDLGAARVRARCSLSVARLISRSRAGTVRTLVAVGTARLASMLAAIAPRRPAQRDRTSVRGGSRSRRGRRRGSVGAASSSVTPRGRRW